MVLECADLVMPLIINFICQLYNDICFDNSSLDSIYFAFLSVTVRLNQKDIRNKNEEEIIQIIIRQIYLFI